MLSWMETDEYLLDHSQMTVFSAKMPRVIHECTGNAPGVAVTLLSLLAVLLAPTDEQIF
jgi:hypothetical protein